MIRVRFHTEIRLPINRSTQYLLYQNINYSMCAGVISPEILQTRLHITRLRMNGDIHPLPNTSLWCGYRKIEKTLTLYLL